MARIIKQGFGELKSVSVAPGEVFCVELSPGDTLRFTDIKGKLDRVEEVWEPSVAILDRVDIGSGTAGNTVSATMMRYKLEGITGDDIVFRRGATSARMRGICYKRLKLEPLYVPGGVQPFVAKGYVAVPAFAMSGTKWFVLPEKTYQSFIRPEVEDAMKRVREGLRRGYDTYVDGDSPDFRLLAESYGVDADAVDTFWIRGGTRRVEAYYRKEDRYEILEAAS